MRHLFLFIFLICSTESFGQNSNDIITRLDDYLKSANNAYRFTGVAAALYKGQIITNKGYGFSDINSQTLNTTETRFPILSVTKSFTSTVILKLQEENKLSVKDKLTKYFPDYPNGSKISIHHLLTHSSGIYDYAWDVGIEDSTIINYPISKEAILNRFKDKPADFRPGKHYGYNNSGYFLLGLIIEKITGNPFETVVKEMIFKPLGMTQSGFDFINLSQSIKAQGYEFWHNEIAVPYKHYDSTFAYAAGSIYSTTNDMLKWAKALRAKEILTAKTWEIAFNPKIQNYGYGWQIGQYFGKKYVKHSGGYPGFMSEFIYYPDEDLIIILLNNFGTYEQNVWSVGMGVSSIVLGLPYDKWTDRREVVVSQEILQQHIGTYKNEKSRIEIRLKADELFAKVNQALELKLYPSGDDDYFLRDFNTTFHFNDNILIIHEHGTDTQWIKID